MLMILSLLILIVMRKKDLSDHLKEPFMTPAEERGDNEDDQYYEEEEALSPEEIKERKEEDDL